MVRIRNAGPLFLLMVLVGCGGGSGYGTGGKGGGGVTGAAGVTGSAGAGMAGSGGITGVAGSGVGGSASCAGGAGAGASGSAGSGGTAGGGATGGGGAVSCAGPDIDIPSALVTGTFKINGAPVTSTSGAGVLSLRTEGGDLVPLGTTSARSYSVRVVPGIYDVVYAANESGALAPSNTAAKLRTATIGDAAAITTLDIDVPSVVVTGSLKINGAIVTSATDAGVVTLRNGTDTVTLGSTSAGSYSVRVVPGNYDVYYKSTEQGPVAPHNFAAKLQSVVIAAGCPTVLDIDVPAASISGTPKIAGAAVATAADAGILWLRTDDGDSVGLGSTTGPYLVKVVPGSYDVYYQSVTAPGVTAPRNTLAKLQSVVVGPTGNTTVDIDVPSVVVNGTLKINGATVTSLAESGNLSLRTSAGDTVALASTAAGSYSVRVAPGSYDVTYQWTAGTTVPLNTLAKLQTVAVAATGTTTLDIDVPSAVVSGTMTINGAPASDGGRLWLRTAAGDALHLGATYSARVVPGTYDVYYQGVVGAAIAPNAIRAKIRSGVIVSTATTTLNVDVRSVSVTGSIKVNNMLVGTSGGYGKVSFRTGEDLINIGPTHMGSYSVRLIPASYDVYYAVDVAGALTLPPQNMLANLRCLTVP